MGISQNGCTVVDESDGSVIDDDEVLFDLKDKVFILLESTDRWTPPKQSTSHQAESVDVKATTASPTNTANAPDTETNVSQAKLPPRVKNVSKNAAFFEFTEKLLSLNNFDQNKLTEVARCLVTLDISEDQWSSLWANQNFVEFVNNCATHPPAAMHVVTLLKSNKTAQKLAPKFILTKFPLTLDGSGTNVEVPKELNSLSEVRQLLQRIVNSERVPEAQLMRALEVSVTGNEQLKREMAAANAMINWSSARRTFEPPWHMDIVKQALANISEYENKHTPKPRPNPSLKNRTHTAATEDLTERETSSTQFTTSSLLGGKMFNVTHTEYYRISAILPAPEVCETQLAGFVGKVLPYALQRVKMRGCCVLQPSRFSALVRSQITPAAKSKMRDPFSPKTKPAKAESKQFACPVSRLDCLTCLLLSLIHI